MKAARERLPSEIIKRGYTDEEIAHIYELARFSLENGHLRRAELILSGLVEIAADYLPAWLALTAVHVYRQSPDQALSCAQQAVRIDRENIEALLFLAACLLMTGDLTSAGTYLGEVGEKLEQQVVDNPAIVRFYKMQLARYQNR